MMRIIRMVLAWVIILAIAILSHRVLGGGSLHAMDVTHGTNAQNDREDIDSLLKKLELAQTNEPSGIVTTGPDLETKRHVNAELVRIANSTPESRSKVVEALIKVLEDDRSREDAPIAYKWTAAVVVLGELKAIEGIDALVRNLGETGETGFVSSRSYRPVSRAIAKIGEAATPQLIEALSNTDRHIRRVAASTLARIGSSPTVDKLKEALYSPNAGTRGGAALALAWIGGQDARAAIEHAMASEDDREAIEDLKEALSEIRRLWEH